MRAFVFFVIASIFLTPFAASAQSTYALEVLCKGRTGNPAGSNLFDQNGSPSIMETFLKQKVLCPSACFDVTLTIGVENNKLKIVTSAVDKCTNPKPDAAKIKNVFSPLEKPNDNRNCVSNKGLPSVIAITQPVSGFQAAMGSALGFKVPDVLSKQKVEGPKSRCDITAMTRVIDAFTQNKAEGLDKGFQELSNVQEPTEAPKPNETTTPEPTPTETPKPDTSTTPTPNSPDAMAKMLEDKYNIPADQAKQIAEEQPDKLKELLEKSSTGDTAGAKELAKELKLNPDLFTEQSTMQPTQMTPERAQQIYEEQKQQRETTTFTQSGEKTDMDKAKQAIANIESSGGKYDMLGPVTRNGDRAYGKYQVMGNNVGPWTQAALGYRMSPQEFLNDPQAQEKVFEHRFGGYAQKYGWEGAARAWFAGEGGMYTSRSDMLGTSVGSYANKFNNYFANGQVLGGGSRYAGGGPFSGITGNYPTSSSYPTGGTNYSGSAFSSANPFYYDGSYSSMSYGYQPYGQQQSNPLTLLFAGLFTGLSSSQSAPTQTIQQVPSQTSPSVVQQQQQKAVVSIIAQPQQAFIGNRIVLSWSSVGMRTNTPCVTEMVTKSGTTTIATGNEGSQIVTASAAGIMRFTISCIALTGNTVTQATNVAVQ